MPGIPAEDYGKGNYLLAGPFVRLLYGRPQGTLIAADDKVHIASPIVEIGIGLIARPVHSEFINQRVAIFAAPCKRGKWCISEAVMIGIDPAVRSTPVIATYKR